MPAKGWARLALLAMLIAGCVSRAANGAMAQDDMFYDPYADGDQDTPSIRRALLICIEDYETAAAPETEDSAHDSPTLIEFVNLETPCADIERIADQLVDLGWDRGSEITIVDFPLPAEQSAPSGETAQASSAQTIAATQPNVEISEAFRKLSNEIRDTENAFGLIYVASHGIEVADRPYIIMPRAKLDIQLAKDRLLKDVNSSIFNEEVALDLIKNYYTHFNGGCTYKCDVVMILDMCREDPFEIFEPLREEIRRAGLKAQPRGQQRGVGALFATLSGATVEEYETTLMADAVEARLKTAARGEESSILGNVIGDIQDQVAEAYKKRGFTQTTELNYSPHNILIDLKKAGPGIVGGQSRRPDALSDGSAAVVPASAPRVAQSALSLQSAADAHNRIARGATSSGPIGGAAALHRASTISTILLADEAIGSLDPDKSVPTIDADVFWCAEQDNSEALRSDAERFGDSLVALSEQRAQAGGRKLGRIRFRLFSEVRNNEPEYQLAKNVVRIDAGSKVEKAWANKIRRIGDAELTILETAEASPDYFAVYFCDGAKPVKRKNERVRIYVSRDDQSTLGAKVKNALEFDPDIAAAAVADAQVVADAEPETDVIYYFREDKVLARAIAEQVSSEIGARVKARRKRRDRPEGLEPGLIDVKIGHLASPFIAQSVCRIGPSFITRLALAARSALQLLKGTREECVEIKTFAAPEGFAFVAPEAPKDAIAFRSVGAVDGSRCDVLWDGDRDPKPGAKVYEMKVRITARWNALSPLLVATCSVEAELEKSRRRRSAS